MPNGSQKIMDKTFEMLNSLTGKETDDEVRAKSKEFDNQMFNMLETDEEALKFAMDAQNAGLEWMGKPTWDTENPNHRRQFMKLMERKQAGETLTMDDISPKPTFGEHVEGAMDKAGTFMGNVIQGINDDESINEFTKKLQSIYRKPPQQNQIPLDIPPRQPGTGGDLMMVPESQRVPFQFEEEELDPAKHPYNNKSMFLRKLFGG